MTLSLHELNHPLSQDMTLFEAALLGLGALSFGVGLGFLVIEGRAKYYSIPTFSICAVLLWFLPYELDISLMRLPVVLYCLVVFAIALITMYTWKMRHGELRETLGEFFHLDD